MRRADAPGGVSLFDFRPVLVGELISRRPFEAADFEPLHPIAADPELWSQHPIPELCEEAVLRAHIG